MLNEETNRIARATIRNQKEHMRLVEDAERKKSLEDSTNPSRVPHEYNRGYTPYSRV